MNLERACQAVIDMAMHKVACHHLGMPQSSAQAFDLLAGAGMLDDDLARGMKGMVGFRNIVIHEYQELDFDILRKVVSCGLDDLVRFFRALGVNIKPSERKRPSTSSRVVFCVSVAEEFFCLPLCNAVISVP